MNKISYGLSVLGASLVLTSCTPADPKTTLRTMKCYGIDKIIPSEIQEIEKSTGGKVGKLCGGHTIVEDISPRSPQTQTVDFTVIIGTQGEMFSVRQDISKFLILEEKKEVQKVPEKPETKYKLR